MAGIPFLQIMLAASILFFVIVALHSSPYFRNPYYDEEDVSLALADQPDPLPPPKRPKEEKETERAQAR